MGGKYKGMALVEEGELERLRQRQIKEYNPSLRTLGQIQEQIEKLFEDPDLSDEGKCKILSHLQERFGLLLTQFKNSGSGLSPATDTKQLQVEIKRDHEEPVADEEPAENKMVLAPQDASLYSIIPSLVDSKIPVQYARKFELFQEFLKEHKNEISTNDKKEVVLDGEAIAYSSFPDLLRSLYVRNQDMNLIGSQQFHTKLHELNVQPDMFSNKDTLSTLGRLDKKSQKHSQTGYGAHPPGKRPRILHVFR